MAYGRIIRNRKKVARAHKKAVRGPSVKTWLGRSTHGGYSAYACLGMGGAKSKPVRHERCSKELSYGRTPQAAIAKALKSLSQVVAKRGRVKPPKSLKPWWVK